MLAGMRKLAEQFLGAPSKETVAQYHSKFGGLWTDRLDAVNLLKAKKREGSLNDELAAKLEFWISNGYIIIEQAVDSALIDEVNHVIEQAWQDQDGPYVIQTGHGDYIPIKQADRAKSMTKMVDLYVQCEAARRMMFAPKIAEFLRAIFEDDVLAFQNLTFEVGSTQAVHQDTAYVVCAEPLKFAASWIALEDIVPGSGELQYYPGSHRYPDFNFGDPTRKHWNIETDGMPAHEAFKQSLHDNAKQLGLELERFYPKKGDALIWAADLAHGGAAITKPGQTRKSFVTHYCPNDVNPNYFSYLPQRQTKIEAQAGCFYSSSHYDIA